MGAPPPQVRAGRQPAGALARTRACWQGTLHLPGPTTSSFAHSAPAHPSPSPPLLPGWWLVMQPPPRALGQARGPCSLGRVAGRPEGARACLKGGFGACPLLRCWAPSHLSAPLPPRRGACSGPAPGAVTWLSDGTAVGKGQGRERLCDRPLGSGDRALGPGGKGHSSPGARLQLEAWWPRSPPLLCLGVCPSLAAARHRGIEGSTAPPTPCRCGWVPDAPWVPPTQLSRAVWHPPSAFQKGDHLPQGPGGRQAAGCLSASTTNSMRDGRCSQQPNR